MDMFKQEDYLLTTGYTPPDGNIGIEETYVLTESPPYDMHDININDINIMPMMTEGIHGDLMVLSPQLEEATMDVATKFEKQEFMPVSPRGPPERKVFAGELDFQVEINAQHTHRKKYLYSSKLNRIYVDMKTDFPVSFSWRGAGAGLWVRAAVVFSDESQAEKRVERCTQHTHETANAELSQAIVKNVLHSSREMGTQGVHYCGQPELADSWYSVLVEFGPKGGSHAYQFVCKNSCSSGINRRAIDVIFTLEDANGRIYGRRTVGARVCSCPRRDMVRDEEEEMKRGGKKRVCAVTSHNPPRNKRVKVETSEADEALVTLPPIQVVGMRSAVAVMQMALSMMETAAGLRPDLAATYRPALAQLRRQVNELTNTHTQPANANTNPPPPPPAT